MGIKLEEVDYIAKLARLKLSDVEREKQVEELNQILSYVKKLNQLNTDDIKPTTHNLSLYNVLREDKIEPFEELEKILSK